MSILIREYGRVILAVVVGTIVITFGIYYSTLDLGLLHEMCDSGIENVADTTESRPVLLAPKTIRLKQSDSSYDEEYFLSLVEGYENSEKREVCHEMDVFGVNDISFSRAGRYEVLYRIENRSGHVFIKTVPVLIYE